MPTAPAPLQLDPPGPGPWSQDGVHFPRPMTRYFQDMHPPAFKAGTQAFARYYGMLIDGLQMAYVQGFGYNQLMPAPEDQIPERAVGARDGDGFGHARERAREEPRVRGVGDDRDGEGGRHRSPQARAAAVEPT